MKLVKKKVQCEIKPNLILVVSIIKNIILFYFRCTLTLVAVNRPKSTSKSNPWIS